jgi:hypothetical protein
MFSRLHQYLAELFSESEMSQTKLLEKMKIHILRSATFFFRKSCPLWDLGKCAGAKDTAQ